MNGELEEELYIEQPEGFKAVGTEDKVYRLHKALYGLKQAPRAWYCKINTHLIKCELMRSRNETTLYIKAAKMGQVIIVSLYVRDLLVTGNCSKIISEFKRDMEDKFEMSDLGLMTYFLSMEINQSREVIFASQQKYANELLKKFKMESCKQVSTPLVQNLKLSKEDKGENVNVTLYRSLIESLLYLTASRPDLLFAASVLSRFMQDPGQKHLVAAKKVLRYVKGTIDYGIVYTQTKNGVLEGLSDSDWAGCPDDFKSTSGYVFTLGSGVCSWLSRKQEVVAQSTEVAEYSAASAAANQAIWLRKVLHDLKQIQVAPTVIKVDNQSALAMVKNLVNHGRTKHIQVKFHAIRQVEKEGEVTLVHCSSKNQFADIVTKPLGKERFEELRLKLGISKKTLKEEC